MASDTDQRRRAADPHRGKRADAGGPATVATGASSRPLTSSNEPMTTMPRVQRWGRSLGELRQRVIP